MSRYCIFFFLFLSSFMTMAQQYEVGESWNRKFILKAPNQIQKWAESVGEIGSSATMFYIGKVQGRHYIITNSHVCPSQKKCLNKRIEFFYHKNARGQSLKGNVKKLAFLKTNLDLALLEVRFTNAVNFQRYPKALKLRKSLPVHNQKLAILGYGFYRNEYGVMMYESAGDCRVFSKTNDIRKVVDPDSINPFPFSVHSFLIGCDVSHGDSGSPIFDLQTGEIQGLLWTGRIPKNPLIRHPRFKELPYGFLWEQLNYAVPSKYIYDVLNRYFNQ